MTLDAKTSANLEKLHKLFPTTPEHKRLSVKKQLKVYFWKVCSALGSSKCERKLQKHTNKPAKLPKKTIAEIKKVLQALRVGNKKRQAFEGGFISEEGIKVCPWDVVRWLMNRSASGTSTRGLLQVFGSGMGLLPSRLLPRVSTICGVRC
jgi:hypothetical protein